MWFFRELLRLIWSIAVATAIASVIAGLWSILSSGDLVHDMRISFLAFGCLMLLLATGGNRSTAAARRVNWRILVGVRSSALGGGRFARRPDEPTLTATAVFGGSAIVLLALGLAV